MKNLKISTKLFCTVAIALLIALGIGSFISSRPIAMAVTLIITLLAVRFSTSYFVSRPLAKIAEMLVNMSDGDFSKNVNLKTSDEIGSIATALNTTLLKLNGLFTMLKTASVEVNSTAQYVGEANDKLADSAVDQSASASVMTITMQKLEQSINALSTDVEMTAQEAVHAHKSAETGEQALELTVNKISNLNDSVLRSSKNVDTLAVSVEKITDVLGVIEDIADQTNLLALNAAIEAARAGESGRGFAVVADEVRKLAESTVKSTLEISNMLQTINNDMKDTLKVMKEGVKISSETEETTNTLFKEIQSVIELVLSISNKVEGMVSVIHQQSEVAEDTIVQVRVVASSAEQNNLTTQENVTKVDGLKNLANRLSMSVAGFKLRNTLVEWTPAISVGVSRFDEEHRYLISLINQLYTALQDESGKKVLSDVLDELLDYTNTHFKFEVSQMEKYGWPDIENHKKLHKFFVDKIVKAREDFRSGTAMLGPELMEFLSDWLISHIQKVDAKYTDFFHSKGVR